MVGSLHHIFFLSDALRRELFELFIFLPAEVALRLVHLHGESVRGLPYLIDEHLSQVRLLRPCCFLLRMRAGSGRRWQPYLQLHLGFGLR